MSQYTDYGRASANYDSTRVPIGVDHIVECLRKTQKPLSEQSLLETGCGTGNYLHALSPHVDRVSGIDFSEGMLAQARQKLGESADLQCGTILDLPYDDNSFDGITCNQVIHHLEKGPGAEENATDWPDCDFASVTKFFLEACRVLKPGGAIVINATTHIQLVNGFWWAALVPAAIARVCYRQPDSDRLQQLLRDANLNVESVTPDLVGVLQGESYLNPDGPLDEEWRTGDSTWSIASETELLTAQEQVRTMRTEGTTDTWMQERESKRMKVGQTTFYCARKAE